MMSDRTVDLAVVSRTLESLLSHDERIVAMQDRVTGQTADVSPELAAAPGGFLPVFLVAADAIWRDATGKSFGVKLVRDPASLLGFRTQGIESGPFSAVMLSMMEAIEQAARPGLLLMNDFDRLWRSIEAGIRMNESIGQRSTPSPGAL
jgi:hypothetical protein